MEIDYYLQEPKTTLPNKKPDKAELSHAQQSLGSEIDIKQPKIKDKSPEPYYIDKILEARKIADNVQNLDELKAALMNFDLCELKFGAKNLVFADGTSSSEIMLIGEAPGATEDEQGIPFCGVSGQLLDNMLYAIGLLRKKNFYITNTVFWRPPDNRQPTPEEVEICRPFVEKHISLIKPKIIVLVGGVAVASLLGPEQQISKIRGHIYQYSNPYIQNVCVTAIFHPAYIIRQPLKKKTAWFDLLQLKKTLQKNNISYC